MSDLDLRELQKSGRIGRIEVTIEAEEGVSSGEIIIPSSLTRKETALLAATIETVSRVGPCSASVKLEAINDIREDKRKQIIERATELLKEWDEKTPEPREIEEQISQDIRVSEVQKWGPDNLPAGPEMEESQDLIIVEGRADVLNLLRIGIKNTIAVEGTQIPKSIIDISRKKTPVTAFLDGDRGGTIILNELLQVAHIDYVARAPDGFEVEDLTRKQMIKALQNKRPVADIIKSTKAEFEEAVIQEKEIGTKKRGRFFKDKHKNLIKILKLDKHSKIPDYLDNSRNTKKAFGINSKQNIVFELDTAEVYEKLNEYSDVKFLILDGILSKRLLSLAINLKIYAIICIDTEEDLQIPKQIIVFKS